ncbi:MAG: ArsR/SmtB family transcription factor [Acidimicrobiia bacterium]
MKVADYTSPKKPPLSLRLMVNSAADLLCALWIMSDRWGGDGLDGLDLGEPWYDDFEAALSPETIGKIKDVGCGDIWISLLPLLPDAGDGGTVDGFIDYLGGMDPADLRFRLVQLHEPFGDEDREVVADAAEGSSDAVEALLGLVETQDVGVKRWRDAIRHLLLMKPEDTLGLIVGTLRDVQRESFATREAGFRPYLEADVASKRAMARRISPERLLEISTSGINLTDNHAVQPIVLVPTMVARPWVVFAPGTEFFMLGYPVADEHVETEGDAPPQWIVKMHKALGDERRLRILRSLAEQDATLAELAERSEISKSTLHHHMMLLRTAGLVRVSVGSEKRYSLRDDTITDAASVLDDYIHGTKGREEA